MGIKSRLANRFNPTFPPTFLLPEFLPHYPMPDTEDFGSQNPRIYRELPMPEDPEMQERSISLRKGIFDVAFGTAEERAAYGDHCFPFDELPLCDI